MARISQSYGPNNEARVTWDDVNSQLALQTKNAASPTQYQDVVSLSSGTAPATTFGIGDVSVSRDGGGAAVKVTIENTGVAASDEVYLEIKTAGVAFGTYTAPHIRFNHNSEHMWYVGSDLTQYDSETFYIGTGDPNNSNDAPTVGSHARVSIAIQDDRNANGFQFHPDSFSTAGTTSDIGTYAVRVNAWTVTWTSDPGDNAAARFQNVVLASPTMLNSGGAQALTSAMGMTNLAVYAPIAGTDLTPTHLSAIHVIQAAQTATPTNYYGIYIDALSGGTSNYGLSTANDISLRSLGELVGVKKLTVSASVDSAAVADEVSFGRYEIGAGNTVIALSQETAVVTEIDETKFSHKMQVRLNGATYFLMLTQT